MDEQSAGATRTAHHAVLGLRVTGGFLSGVELQFADGLNCLIGGRGAGKTTVLEFLRFGLGLMPDPKINIQRHRSIESLVKANLGGGRLNVELRTKTGMRYTAGRAANETVQVLNETGAAVPISLARDLIFGADVFSQNEIEEMASSPAAQLALLDRFQEGETLTLVRDLEVLQSKLRQSNVDLRRIDGEVDDLRAQASELNAIEEKLKGFVEVGGSDAEKINAANTAKDLRTIDEKVPDAVLAAMQKAAQDINASVAAYRASTEAQFDGSVREGSNREILAALESEARAFADVLTNAASSVAYAMQVADDNIKVHRGTLAERHAVQEAEYRAMISESEQQGGRAAERNVLQASLATALAASKDQQAKEKQRQTMMEARGALLKRVSEIRDERFALRKRIAERLTQQFSSIRVTVAQAAELQEYKEVIVDALKGVGLKQGPAADKLSQAFLPTELAQAVMKRDYQAVMQRAGFDDDRAKKVVDILRSSGAAYAIEIVDLHDRPHIELLDGNTYKESSNLSTGQRCTTILPILLVQSERPLLIDQPEDNLDNAFVYETIVKALRIVKGNRQIIFVTHNPNIPVLGQAERVFVFASDGQQATLRQVGSVDDCKEHIERILEGGREAFLERKNRYGH